MWLFALESEQERISAEFRMQSAEFRKLFSRCSKSKLKIMSERSEEIFHNSALCTLNSALKKAASEETAFLY